MKISSRLCIAVMIVIFFGVTGCSGPSDNTGAFVEAEGIRQAEELLVYCGAGLRKPMEEIGALFEEETGIMVQFSYGGAAQCTSQILTVDRGDVFLPGDMAELKDLLEKGKVDRQKPVVLHIPVLAVPRGNPAKISGIEDLAGPGVKVVLGDPEANPIGKLADQVLKDRGLFEEVQPNIIARAATVNQLFACLALKQADVSIIWEDNLVGNEEIELIQGTDFDQYIKTVPVVSLKCSTNPEAANRFVEFVAGKKVISVWEKCGFKPAPEV